MEDSDRARALQAAWEEVEAIDYRYGLDIYEWAYQSTVVHRDRRARRMNVATTAISVTALAHEVLVVPEPRLPVLVVWFALLGLPIFSTLAP